MPSPANPLLNQLQPGDIVAFYGRDWRSLVIQFATLGPSHVGIIAEWELTHRDGTISREMVLVESTTMCNHYCLHTNQLIDGVQVQSPAIRVADYGGRAKLFRLAPDHTLTNSQSARLTKTLRDLVGKSYDLAGAFWSGTNLLKYLPFFGYSDGGTLFCSQLIAKCLMKFGKVPLGNAGCYNPGSLIRTVLSINTYQRGVPL